MKMYQKKTIFYSISRGIFSYYRRCLNSKPNIACFQTLKILNNESVLQEYKAGYLKYIYMPGSSILALLNSDQTSGDPESGDKDGKL